MAAVPGYATGMAPPSAPWQQTVWSPANNAGATTSYSGASGVRPAAGMDLTSLTNYINSLNRTGQTAALNARIPGGPELEAKSSANISGGLKGEVPADVIRLRQQQAAERGVGTGVGGMSDNNNAAYLQALGLTSIGVQEQAQKDLTAAEGRNPAAPLFDPTSQLLTPYQSGTLALNAQAEADRNAEAMARLATAGGGEVTPRVLPGGGGYQTPTTTATPGATGAALFPGNDEYTTADWWSNIGFTPGQGVSPTGTSAGFYAGEPNYDELFGRPFGPAYDPTQVQNYDPLFDPELYPQG